jgi:hypothetical protein
MILFYFILFFDIYNAYFHEQTYVGHYLCMNIYFEILSKNACVSEPVLWFLKNCSYES